MCEECYKPEDMFKVIRRSHIEQYAGCPYSLYLQLVLDIAPPMNKHAQLGIIVHKIIESIQSDKLDPGQANRMLEDLIEEWNLSTDDEYCVVTMELEELGKTCLSNFYAMQPTLCSDFKVEHNVRYSLDDDLPMISCTIDRVEFVGEDIYVRDWKTGMSMSGKTFTTDLQAPLYIYGVANEFGKYPKTFTLEYLKKGKSIVFVLQPVGQDGQHRYVVTTSRGEYTLHIEEAVKRTKRILRDIKAQKFDMPSNSTHIWRCKNLCWFGISGKCTGMQTEQWKAMNEKYAKDKPVGCKDGEDD